MSERLKESVLKTEEQQCFASSNLALSATCLEDSMDEQTIDRHSVNCYFCCELMDEREGFPADQYNHQDGGTICPKCKQILEDLAKGWGGNEDE